MNVQTLASPRRKPQRTLPASGKRACTALALALAASLATISGRADLNIPSNGSDGELNITMNTVIDLSRAVTGAWNDVSSHPGDGIYDPNKWAVVFHYTKITVAAGATVTFKNHPKRPPVVWLVQGDVTIDGTVSLDGEGEVVAPRLGEPGPGGFRGGGGDNFSVGFEGSGFGLGGGRVYEDYGYGSLRDGGGGNFAAPRPQQDGNVRPNYGNPSLLPLLGGSGGAGGGNWPDRGTTFSGGGGGGAILIACGMRLSVYGGVRANGGSPGAHDPSSGGGSGGSIRLVARDLVGNGSIQVMGGSFVHNWGVNGIGAAGGIGRIRIERVTPSADLRITPDAVSVVQLEDGATPQIWLPDSGPTVKIVSVNNQNAPADPRAEFAAIGADLVLPQVSTSEVVVETTNVERESTVKVRVTPRSNGNYTLTPATLDQVVTEDPLVIRWKASVPVNNGYSALQVHVVRP